MMIMPVCVVMANEKPQVRMVVSSTPGSLPDVLSRPVTKYLQSQGYEVITDYRPGAGNSIGTRYFVNIKPEKNQVVLLAGNATVALHEFYSRQVDAGSMNKLKAGVLLGKGRIAVFAHPSLPAKEFRDLDKLNKEQITFATPGLGTLAHLIGIELQKYIRTPLQHVPYQGAHKGISDLAGGHVDLVIQLGGYLDWVRDGRLKLLAVGESNNWTGISGVKTLPQQGINLALDDINMHMIFAHADNDPTLQQQVSKDMIQGVMNDIGIRTVLSGQDLLIPNLEQQKNMQAFVQQRFEILRQFSAKLPSP
jgi:tripartite-type tricarboxylate transporter receptor subunit TctC